MIGAQLAVVGCVGVFAATAPTVLATFVFEPPGANESVVLSFSPTGVLGHRELRVYVPSPLDGFCSSVPRGCAAAIEVASCLDPTCQSLGAFRAHGYYEGVPGGAAVAVPAAVGTLIVTLLTLTVLPVTIQMSWTDVNGIPVCFTLLGLTFLAGMCAGLVTVPSALLVGKRAGVRWVREIPLLS